ncbi:MAG: BspA family leucine-rich repeat surface protein [Bacteroidales bacterium]
MKSLIFTITTVILLLLNGQAFAQNKAFIATYSTPEGTLEIPVSAKYKYKFDIDWNNDGIFDEIGVSKEISHTYTDGATSHTVAIRGQYPKIRNGYKISDVSQWGDIQWKTMEYAFNGSKTLTNFSATDVPNLSMVTNMKGMFHGCILFNDDLNNWNVSNVTNMSFMFTEAKVFNGNISSWNVSNVLEMQAMFREAYKFNGDISNWNVSNVTDMIEMFKKAYKFNSDISNWNVSSVVEMYGTFNYATDFNSDISSWDVSNVKYLSSTFENAESFNCDLSSWNVSNCTTFEDMFKYAKSFKGDISTWDVSNATTMKGMFEKIKISENNYNKMLANWSKLSLKKDIRFDAGNSYYTSDEAEVAHKKLIDELKWVITDKGYKGIRSPFIAKYSLKNHKLVIPVVSGYTYNFDIDWDNDGVFDDLGVTSEITHTYPNNVYSATVAIRGNYPIIKNGKDVKDIIQWGGVPWENLTDAFNANANLKKLSAEDYPNLTQVSSLEGMFAYALYFEGPVNNWDVSNITNMSSMFEGTIEFDANLNFWDVSKVTNMEKMFYSAKKFNKNLNSWNTKNVSNFKLMFSLTKVFNGDISSWDVSGATSMNGMFYKAAAFNKDLNSWNVSNVTDFSHMFRENSIFNGNISSWDVSNAKDMYAMFYKNSVFNQDISNWDVSKVTTMEHLFNNAVAFNANVSSWNVSKVAKMNGMFSGCTLPTDTYNAILIEWSKLSLQPTVNFNAGEQTKYSGSEAKTAKDKLITDFQWEITDGGDDSPKRPFIATFKTAKGIIEIPVSTFADNSFDIDWENDGTFDEMGITETISHTYADGAETHTVAIKGNYTEIVNGSKIIDVAQWGDIQWRTFNSSFMCNNDIEGFSATDIPDLSNVTSMRNMFYNAIKFNSNISNWDVSAVTEMNSTFSDAEAFNCDISGWDVSNVTDMRNMFSRTEAFNIDINGWDVSKVTDMTDMFRDAKAFNQDLNDWDVSSVTSVGSMFSGATVFNGDISKWDVSKVNKMKYMFNSASAFNQDISKWDVSKVTDMSNLFYNAKVFNADISSWDVSNVNNMQYIFAFASSFNQDLSNWDVSSVTDMNNMFNTALAFNQNISSWDVSKVTDMTNMFLQISISSKTYNEMLIAWSKLNLQSDVSFNAGNTYYSSDEAEVARKKIIDTYNWNITDLGKEGEASFSLSENVIEVGKNVTFTNTTTGVKNDYNVIVDLADGVVVSGDTQTSAVVRFDSEGEKTISMRIKIGDWESETVSKTLMVANSPVADFKASKTDVKTNEELQLTAEIEKSYDNNTSIQWVIGKNTISDEVSPKVSFDKEGYYNVSLTVTNFEQLSVTISKENYIHVSKKVGLAEVCTNNIKAFPQPANTFLNIKLPEQGEYNVEIFNIQGVLVSAISVNGLSTKINVSNFRPGTYIVHTMNMDNQKFSNLKIVIN